MDIQEYPRIGNRSDALDLLDKVIKRVVKKADDRTIEIALKALRDAIEREIL
jgi:hypothetical protein